MATSNNLDGLASSSSSSVGSEATKRPASSQETQVLDKKRLQELVREVDPNEQLDVELYGNNRLGREKQSTMRDMIK